MKLYSDFLNQKKAAYFQKYGWSIGREMLIDELMNEAYKEGQLKGAHP